MKDYNDCDVDVCNGMKIGGHYAYVATFFHPYIMGCYGPGDSPNLYHQCSANPRKCNVQDDDDHDAATILRSAFSAVAAAGILISQIVF